MYFISSYSTKIVLEQCYPGPYWKCCSILVTNPTLVFEQEKVCILLLTKLLLGDSVPTEQSGLVSKTFGNMQFLEKVLVGFGAKPVWRKFWSFK